MDIKSMPLHWRNEAAKDLFEAHRRAVADIRASFAVPNVNVTATQAGIMRDTEERRRMLERMEMECKPLAEAMADLQRRFAGPLVVIDDYEPAPTPDTKR